MFPFPSSTSYMKSAVPPTSSLFIPFVSSALIFTLNDVLLPPSFICEYVVPYSDSAAVASFAPMSTTSG